jgi:hypothetical protein
MSARLILSLALVAAATPGFSAVSGFASNEVRTAGAKDRLRGIKTTLKDGTEGAKRHSDAITAAFKDTGDWAVATEAYYARKSDLVARAEALETRFDDLIGRNAPERADEVTKALDEACKHEAVLRSDYEFYMKLPRLAEAPERRHAAQAAMRLLGSTGDYPVSLAYFLDKTPNRPPFAPLPPGVMAIRHQDAGAAPSR